MHYVGVVSKKGALKLIPIPYDFDYSGFVGTSYAAPRPSLDVTSIYVPVWLGKDVTPDEMRATCANFKSRREAAEALITNYPELDNRSKNRLLKRLEDYYKLLENDKRLMKLLK